MNFMLKPNGKEIRWEMENKRPRFNLLKWHFVESVQAGASDSSCCCPSSASGSYKSRAVWLSKSVTIPLRSGFFHRLELERKNKSQPPALLPKGHHCFTAQWLFTTSPGNRRA